VSDLGKAEILHTIKEAEEKVREMTRDGEEKRKQLQAEGKRRAIEIAEKAEAELKNRIVAQTAVVKSDIDRRKKAILEDGSGKADALASKARQNIGRAKEFILSEFERSIDA